MDPVPTSPAPNMNGTTAAIIRARVDGVEDWLADFSSRVTGFPQPDDGTGRPNSFSESREMEAQGENRVYSSIGDYLTHMGSMSEKRRRELSEEKEREEATRQRTFVNQHSRQLVERMRMRRIVELYDLLDWQGVGYIDLSNIDDKMNALSPEEQAFLQPILERHAAVETSMDMETFVSLMTAHMSGSTTGPLTALTSSRKSARDMSSADELNEQRRSNFTFQPAVSGKSNQIVKESRANSKQDQASRQQRWAFLANERAIWGQRREALERKKEAEEMAQCTFTPNINTRTRSGKKNNKFHFMSPIRVTNNVLSSEERELLEHCTFTPNRKPRRG